MKKQILILTFFTLALFAGMNVFAQYQTAPTNIPTCLTPVPLDPTCSTIDELHPQPGVEYNYIVETSNATDDVRWFVVNNLDLKTAPVDSIINSIGQHLPVGDAYIDPADGSGSYILSLGTYNDYDVDATSLDGSGTSFNTTGTEHQIDITWKFFNGMSPNEVLLVGIVEGDDGCTDNIFVYRIIPEPAFTLDVAALNTAGDSVAGPSQTGVADCVSPIESASYLSVDDIVGNGTLTVDWGENWVYFIVNANNFVDSWWPEFQISYDGGVVDPLEASWTYIEAADNATATWNTLTDAAGTWTGTVPVIAGGSTAAGVANNAAGAGAVSGAGGECIVVRVRVDHGTTNENTDIAGQIVTLAANGIMYDNDDTAGTFYDDRAAYEDLHHGDCSVDDFQHDVTNGQLTPRPEVDENIPTPFEFKTGDE